MKIKWLKIILVFVILVIASIFSFTADKVTIPMQNEAMISQLNGGDAEMVTMHATNSLLQNIRLSVFPVASFLCMLVLILEILRIKKEIDKKEDKLVH